MPLCSSSRPGLETVPFGGVRPLGGYPCRTSPIQRLSRPTGARVKRASPNGKAGVGIVSATAETPSPSRPDDVLPNNLADSINQASQSTAAALKTGADRCTVEILLPEFWNPLSGAVFSEEGDQQRFWKMTRRFVDDLAAASGFEKVTVLYPDMGVTAMLKNQWTDVQFVIDCLNDRRPYRDDDEVVVIAAPDPLGADDVQRIAADLQGRIPLILFNPRLASADVGVGLNVRRIRARFLDTFLTTYSIQPIGDVGSVFRRFPGMWQVFVEDQDMPGRYKLAAERPSQPTGEGLEYIISSAMNPDGSPEDDSSSGVGVLDQIASTVSSLQRFMKSLSN